MSHYSVLVSLFSGDSGPVLEEFAPAADGTAVLVSWSWPESKSWSLREELLNYVLEWTSACVACTHAPCLQWQTVAKDENNASITGTELLLSWNLLRNDKKMKWIHCRKFHSLFSFHFTQYSRPEVIHSFICNLLVYCEIIPAIFTPNNTVLKRISIIYYYYLRSIT